MDGLLIIDKPVGLTSHDVVVCVRRAFGQSRVGHTGTLDRAASGVLPIVLGRATRLARFLSASSKTYQVSIRLGIETETYDSEGEIVSVHRGPLPGVAEVNAALEEFRGTFMQRPPAFSAKKIHGTRSYELARRRKPGARTESSVSPHLVEAAAPFSALESMRADTAVPGVVEVTAHSIVVTHADIETVALCVDCSAGFYVRSLAHDMGQRLQVGAHVASLRRTRCGVHTLDAAIPLGDVERCLGEAPAGGLIPMCRMLQDLPALTLTAQGKHRMRHGRDLLSEHFVQPREFVERAEEGSRCGARWFRLLDSEEELLGLAETVGSAHALHPSIVLM